jgi:hypothetical protein
VELVSTFTPQPDSKSFPSLAPHLSVHLTLSLQTCTHIHPNPYATIKVYIRKRCLQLRRLPRVVSRIQYSTLTRSHRQSLRQVRSQIGGAPVMGGGTRPDPSPISPRPPLCPHDQGPSRHPVWASFLPPVDVLHHPDRAACANSFHEHRRIGDQACRD